MAKPIMASERKWDRFENWVRFCEQTPIFADACESRGLSTLSACKPITFRPWIPAFAGIAGGGFRKRRILKRPSDHSYPSLSPPNPNSNSALASAGKFAKPRCHD